jgi:lysophospholipase L1-like esterase
MTKLLLAVLLLLPATAAPVKIVCIGDSITQGRKGGGANKPTQSWRYPLWKKLVDLGATVDFVGSLAGGFEGDPEWPDYKGKTFDREHEGHWGWTTKGVREKLPEWIKGYNPDVALILLGTNDPNPKLNWTLEDTAKEMEQLIDILRAKNAKVTILLGKPFQEWKPFPEMRDRFDALAKAKSTAASPIVTVDLSKGWVSNPDTAGSHTVDWVHPNADGDARLAGLWLEALQPQLQRLKALK